MLIRCPKCQTGFNLPAEKIPPGGAKLKCSACTHSFRVRVGSDEKPNYFYKRGEQPPPGWNEEEEEEAGTMVGSPNLGMGLDEESEKTQFGFNSRSKSAEQGYNPFPLATGTDEDEPDEASQADDHGNSTQLFSGAGNTIDISDEIDLVMAIEEGDDANDRTSIGRAGIIAPPDESNDRTQIGVVGGASESSAGPPAVPDADASGARTQALGSGVDLFDGELFDDDDDDDEPRGGAPIDDYDPFGDAFESPMGDVGLLMPSTLMQDDSSPAETQSGLDEISAVNMSEESLFLGGQESEFGPADELVDPSFGLDLPAFDAQSGVVDQMPNPKPQRNEASRRPSGEFASREGNIELGDVQSKPVKKQQRRSGQASMPEKAQPRREARAPREAPAGREAAPGRAKIQSDYAAHRVGASSPIRRAFDIAFITLVVIVGALAFVASRSGGFIDFARFGHMLEVAFEGKDFEPREEWKQVVEVSTTPPPEEPLRLRDVRAFDQTVGDERVFVIVGKIRNYSLTTFQGLELRAEVVDPDNKIIAEQTQPAGRLLDLSAVKKAKSSADVESAVETKIPDIGKEGVITFAFVFADVPAAVLAKGDFSYRVALTE